MSDFRTLSCGIPQGTIIGPLLFLIYINDLPNCLDFSDTKMYADDTNLTVASPSSHEIEQKLNKDLENIGQWLKANRLSLNTTKTEFLLVASRQRSSQTTCPVIQIGDTCVPRITSTKSLGLHIDEALSWSKHIEEISKKLSSAIGALKRARHYVPTSSLQIMYNSFIQPIFDYCSVVWEGLGTELARKIQKLQNRAARIITFSNFDSSSDPLLEKLEWDRLSIRRTKLLATEMFKVYNNQAPEYLTEKFHKGAYTP